CRIDEASVIDRVSAGDIDYLHVCTPNNPTGDVADPGFVERLLDATDALVVVDEAYGEFAPDGTSAVPLLARHKNLAILRTFSKAYSLAGARVGYLLASSEVIRELQKVRQPYSVDALSQMVALEVFRRRELFAQRTAQIVSERERVFAKLSRFSNVEVWPSGANFLLLRVDRAAYVWERLLGQGVLVRNFSSNALTADCLRVSIGSPEQNDAFLKGLARILDQEREYLGQE
ncbi:MAG: aminotransferase class I/II-fold pyridoxal phosphate-dependent enzyme, partial [Eggerthellaceae bacterium]|nr:aminotransferase class I/II-fold pyridoxal phosphate-dependent enzyme [Eggerthellaceae bacterium]